MSDTGADQLPTATETQPDNPAETVDAVLAAKNGEGAPEAPKDAPKDEKPKVEEPKKEDSQLAKKFAALSKREKAIRDRERAIEAKEKAAKETPAPKAAEPEKAPLKLRMKQSPFETLKEEFGLDLETLTAIAKNEGKLTPEMQLRLKQEQLEASLAEKLAAVEKKLADKEQQETEQKQKDAESAALREFKSEAQALLKEKAADYELLAMEDDAAQVILDVISAHYEKTKGHADPEQPDVGRILSIKEAADLVESHLLDEAKKYTSLSKIKGLFGAQAAPAAKGDAKPESTATKTLSNEQTGEAPPASKKRATTREEELAEAMKLLKYMS